MRLIKTIIKNIIFLLGVIFNYNKKSKVLYYHDVHRDESYTDMSTSIELFKNHIKAISESGFKVVPSITDEKRQVAIMFDDGFRGIYDCREYLYANKICPTVFLAVSLIGQPGYLTVEEIKELQEHGFNFQSHGWRHIDMTSLSAEELKLELVEARLKLGEILGKKINQICLPIGYFSDGLLKMIQEEGYDDVFSSIPGNYGDKIFGMRRRNLVQSSSKFQVSLILKGGMSLISGRYLKLHKR